MEEKSILNEIKSSLDQSIALRNQLQGVIEKANRYCEEVKQLTSECKKNSFDLSERERIVKEKEGKIFSAEVLEEQRRQIQESLIEIQNLRVLCDRECAVKRAVLADEMADMASKIKDLELREKALEEEKRTYKEKLLRKMGKGS